MLLFYAYQRGVLALPEGRIWSRAYFEPGWQAFFDLFNSLPLLAVAGVLAWRIRAAGWLAVVASMALHSTTDLLLHHDDAHAHLFPLSAWRFRSPLSYWDPAHHGRLFAVAELVFVTAGAAALMRRSRSTPWRLVGGVTLAAYAGFVLFAMLVWM
jgi:hypothetical protein